MLKRRSFLFAAVGFLVSTAFYAVADAFSAGYRMLREAYYSARGYAIKLFVGPQPVDTGWEPRLASRNKAAFREFQTKIVKREQPRIEGSWRMCPSC